MYLATDKDGSGPWLHSDVERRMPHRMQEHSDVVLIDLAPHD
jgi:hypothetical protein